MALTRWRLAAMLLPALVVAGGTFSLGMFEVLRQSVGLGVPVAGESGPTLSHYAAVLGDREIHAALGLTLWVACISTALSVVCGVGLALGLRHGRRAQRGVHTLLQAPLAIPHLVVALATITVFAQSGLLARAAFALGLIDSPSGFPVLVNDSAGLGIILSYAFKEVPFIALVATTLLARRGDEHDQVARTLGASPWQRFRHVTWPFLATRAGSTESNRSTPR